MKTGCALAVLAFAPLLIVCSSVNADFIHPGIAHSQAELDFVKAKLKADEQPWQDAWEKLRASRYARLSWKPKPHAVVERGAYNNPDIGASDFMRDGTAAYTHALQWVFTGNEAHARKTMEIFNVWSATLKTVKNHDARLLVGMTGHQFCNAAELIKHTWDGWPIADQKQFESMLRNVWYPVIADFYPTANGNWDASMIQTMLAMGVFLDDREMFDRAVDYYLKGEGNGAIQYYINAFGECQESGRDQSHTQMGLEYLGNACETAWAQGVDLYGAYDNRLLKGIEYTAKYNLGFDVPYEPYISFKARYKYRTISDKGRGRLRPLYERVYNHYHNRMGLEMPFAKQAVDNVRPEAGGRSSLPWGTLMFAGQTNLRRMKYTKRSADAATAWQQDVRARLFHLLKMDDLVPAGNQIALNERLIRSEKKGSYEEREVEINSTPQRRIRVLVTLPTNAPKPWPAVVCIHGHGGNMRSVHDKNSIYKGFAAELAARGYATVSTDVGQHKVYEANRTLMGERLWDLMRCIDYLESIPDVDPRRIGCAGLSLGGEMAMWLGGMDTRVAATVSSGFLTRMDQMEKNHCMCWKFAGLRDLVDYADIYALIAPRALVCQNGAKEPPTQFPPSIAREALTEIKATYADMGKPNNVALDVHEGAHEIDLANLLEFFEQHLMEKVK